MLGVAVDGELEWTTARGRTETGGRGLPLDTTTSFCVASLAKQVTAAAVALLIEDDMIDADDPVRDHLPELPRGFDDVIVTDLVHQLSGVPSLDDQPIRRRTADAWWLGLGTWDLVELADAIGHSIVGDNLEPDASDFHFVSDGGLVTTVDDLAMWAGVHAGPHRLGAALATQLTDQGRLRDRRQVHYAWGISVRQRHGLTIHSHGGQFVGNLAKLVQLPGDPSITSSVSPTETTSTSTGSPWTQSTWRWPPG